MTYILKYVENFQNIISKFFLFSNRRERSKKEEKIVKLYRIYSQQLEKSNSLQYFSTIFTYVYVYGQDGYPYLNLSLFFENILKTQFFLVK